METRAHHTLIGAFVLGFIVIGVSFSLWLGKYQFDRQFVYYDIVYPESVAGLNVGSDVRYQGILVGEVAQIRVDPVEREKIRVTVRVEKRDDIEIRTTTKASLEIQGLTGGVFVLITNPSTGGDLLRIDYSVDGLHDVIQYEPSSLQSLFSNFPQLLKTGDALLNDLRALLNAENRQVISDTLRSVADLTGTLADSDEDIRRIISNTATLTGEATTLAQQATVLIGDLDALTKNVDTFLGGEGQEAIAEFAEAAQSIDVLASDLSRIIRDNEVALGTFANQGLAQLALFVSDARRLAVRLERFTRRLEANPSGLLLGGTTPQQIPRKE